MAPINIFISSILFDIAFIKTSGLALPLGLHFMANYMQGPVLGFGVSGGESPGLLKPVFDDALIWHSGCDFGIEAGIGGLCIFIIVVRVNI